jgi:hypothetical protein
MCGSQTLARGTAIGSVHVDMLVLLIEIGRHLAASPAPCWDVDVGVTIRRAPPSVNRPVAPGARTRTTCFSKGPATPNVLLGEMHDQGSGAPGSPRSWRSVPSFEAPGQCPGGRVRAIDSIPTCRAPRSRLQLFRHQRQRMHKCAKDPAGDYVPHACRRTPRREARTVPRKPWRLRDSSGYPSRCILQEGEEPEAWTCHLGSCRRRFSPPGRRELPACPKGCCMEVRDGSVDRCHQGRASRRVGPDIGDADVEPDPSRHGELRTIWSHA